MGSVETKQEQVPGPDAHLAAFVDRDAQKEAERVLAMFGNIQETKRPERVRMSRPQTPTPPSLEDQKRNESAPLQERTPRSRRPKAAKGVRASLQGEPTEPTCDVPRSWGNRTISAEDRQLLDELSDEIHKLTVIEEEEPRVSLHVKLQRHRVAEQRLTRREREEVPRAPPPISDYHRKPPGAPRKKQPKVAEVTEETNGEVQVKETLVCKLKASPVKSYEDLNNVPRVAPTTQDLESEGLLPGSVIEMDSARRRREEALALQAWMRRMEARERTVGDA